MMRHATLLLAALALVSGAFAAPLAAQSRGGDQRSAREEMQAGRNLPIRDIERRIIPRMEGGEYLGFEYDSTAQVYRLKFIIEGRVVWVDVDAQNARILRVSR